jgi:hypothetical protein
MPNLDPHMRAESLRPKSDREQMLARIAAECGAAWLAAKEGEHHHRHYNSIDSRKKAETANSAWLASFLPVQPQIIVTAPLIQRDVFSDYLDRHHGAGGAARQE